jgi:uncharacterized protein YoxC
MDKELIDALKELTEAVKDLTQAVDTNSARQSEMFDRNIQMGDYISSLTHKLEKLKESIDKKL